MDETADNRWDRENWRVLFLLSPSPGAVFRFLERRALAGEDVPSPLYLSDPAPPHGYRLFYAPSASPAELKEVAARLSGAFPHPVYLLYRRGGESPAWGYVRWEGGEGGEEKEEALPSPKGWQRLLSARLAGPLSVLPPFAWADRRGLPLGRLPFHSRSPVPIVEYATVAALDQRSLLVEGEARLYRF